MCRRACVCVCVRMRVLCVCVCVPQPPLTGPLLLLLQVQELCLLAFKLGVIFLELIDEL